MDGPLVISASPELKFFWLAKLGTALGIYLVGVYEFKEYGHFFLKCTVSLNAIFDVST